MGNIKTIKISNFYINCEKSNNNNYQNKQSGWTL